MWIGHRKEIRKLTFRALALRRSDSTQLIKPNYLVFFQSVREKNMSFVTCFKLTRNTIFIVDTDECYELDNPCHATEKCQNQQGAYACVCDEGCGK